MVYGLVLHLIPVLISKKSPPYKPDKPHDGNNGDEITRPVKRPGGEAELVYIAEFGFTGWAFTGLQGQMGIALGAFLRYKTVTAGSTGIITTGHVPSPFINCFAWPEPSMNSWSASFARNPPQWKSDSHSLCASTSHPWF